MRDVVDSLALQRVDHPQESAHKSDGVGRRSETITQPRTEQRPAHQAEENQGAGDVKRDVPHVVPGNIESPDCVVDGQRKIDDGAPRDRRFSRRR